MSLLKKALFAGIIVSALAGIGMSATALAYDYWNPCEPFYCDPCTYYGDCEDVFGGNFNNNYNSNINNIDIGGGFTTSIFDDWYDDDRYDDEPECDDNRDNDHDGDYDYPEDEGCRSYSDDSEDSEDYNDDEPECDDNRDNDDDGDEDYPEDRGCSSRNDNSEDSDDNDNNDDEPEVTTRSATSIDEDSAVLNGRVDGNGLNTRVWFEYSDDRDDVDNDEETNEDSVGSGTVSFDDRITGLREDTTYYFRAVAENSDGKDYGSIMSFTTDDDNDNDRECDDNRDNDRDGDEDYPDDEGCSSRNDDSEDSENDDEPECDDNRDNDRDGDEDYPEDRGCSSRNDNSEDSDDNDSGRAPYFVSTPTNLVTTGQLYSYNADALSPNNRAITYKLALSPSGMTINQFTGLVQWSVPAGLAGTYQPVLVVATDTEDNSVSQSYIISVRAPIINPPVVPPVNPPSTQLRITGLRTDEVGGDVIVSFNTNIDARGSVRYGQVSEASKDDDFTYPFSQVSEGANDTFHQVNLGPLEPNNAYFIRAFASAGSRSAISSEFTFTRTAPVIDATAEVLGTATCIDGIDNDRDGVADNADTDCQEPDEEGATFASALESFGKFLISPWFLMLVIIVLVVYIILTRRNRDVVSVHGPIEIKS